MQSNDDKRTETSAVPAAVDAETEDAQPGTADPGVAQVRSYLMYGLSLPERALRSTTAVVGGAVGGSMRLLLPQAFRSSRSYSIFVQQMLDFMVRDMGGVELPTEEEDEQQDQEVESFVARKTVGTFVEMAGWATMHLSPVTVLAIFSDLAYGSKTYLNELSSELKAKGLIDEETTIDQVSDLLDAVSTTSGMTAEAFDMPPISVEGLKKTVAETKKALSQTSPTQLIPQSELQRLWGEMKETAKQQDVTMFSVSSTMTLYTLNKVGTVSKGALSSVTVAGNMFDRHILDHYRSGLGEIRQRGIYPTLSQYSQPYMDAVWSNFSRRRATFTEDLFSGKLFIRGWRILRSWCCRSKKKNAVSSQPADVEKRSGHEQADSPES